MASVTFSQFIYSEFYQSFDKNNIRPRIDTGLICEELTVSIDCTIPTHSNKTKNASNDLNMGKYSTKFNNVT